jgi:hypothetical protein
MPPSDNADPFKVLQGLWSQFPSPLPGFVAPSADADELAKRIRELKTVEGWLQSNLSLLQNSIRALEVQHATVLALRSMAQQMGGDAPTGEARDSNAWPWELLQQSSQAWLDAARKAGEQTAASPTPETKAEHAKPRRKKP